MESKRALSFTECNAGYYRIYGICAPCAGNKIKTMIGDAPHCDDDAACDGLNKTPNDGHTACGSFMAFADLIF